MVSRHFGLDSFLANRASYAPELEKLLALDEVAGHELLYVDRRFPFVNGRGGAWHCVRERRLDGSYSLNAGLCGA